jgi:hypothetical protein
MREIGLIPAKRDRPLSFELPAIEAASDASRPMAAILTATASGDVTPSEAEALSKLIETHLRTLEATEL